MKRLTKNLKLEISSRRSAFSLQPQADSRKLMAALRQLKNWKLRSSGPRLSGCPVEMLLRLPSITALAIFFSVLGILLLSGSFVYSAPPT